MTLFVVAIDNVTGEELTGEYVEGLDDDEVPVAGLLRVLNAANWKGS